MIFVDSSAWIEFLRDTGSAVCEETDRLLESEIVIADPVLMEVTAGARDEKHLRDLRAMLARARMAHCDPTDYEAAASLYRQCRRQGGTVRKLIDCLIAAVAIREKVPVLHSDSDFNTLARYTELTLHKP